MIDRKAIFGLGLSRAAKMRAGFLAGVGFGGIGIFKDVALIGFQAKRAGRGGFVSAVIGQGISLGLGTIATGVFAAGLCAIPGIGPFAAAIIADVLMTYPEYAVGTSLTKGVRLLTDANKNIRHLEMGGSYRDSEFAQRQRLIALQDMSGSMVNSRRYLGREALLMHR